MVGRNHKMQLILGGWSSTILESFHLPFFGRAGTDGSSVDVCLKIFCFHPEDCTQESTSKTWFVTNAIVRQNHKMQVLFGKWTSTVSDSPLFPFFGREGTDGGGCRCLCQDPLFSPRGMYTRITYPSS